MCSRMSGLEGFLKEVALWARLGGAGGAEWPFQVGARQGQRSRVEGGSHFGPEELVGTDGRIRDLGFTSEPSGMTWNLERGSPGNPGGLPLPQPPLCKEGCPWSYLEPQAQASSFEGRSPIPTGAGNGWVGSWEWPLVALGS